MCSVVQGMKGKDDMSDSDEDTHDAYLERMKEEGKIREEGGSDDSDGDESGEGRVINHHERTDFLWIIYFTLECKSKKNHNERIISQSEVCRKVPFHKPFHMAAILAMAAISD